MARPTPENPVITPSQARSRVTFETIIEATTYLIEEIGVRKITTNRIADRSGVNINSIYRYFLDKNAIIALIVERFAADNMSAFTSFLEETQEMERNQRIAVVLDSLLHRFMERPAFRRELLLNAPSTLAPEKLQQIKETLTTRLAIIIPNSLFPTDDMKKVAAELIYHTFMSGTAIALSPKLGQEEREKFRTELRSLLLRYVGVEWETAVII